MEHSALVDKNELIERFKAFYQDAKHPQLKKINEVYASHIRFKDPVHEFSGIETLHAYLSGLCENMVAGRFEYLDQLVGENRAYIKWNMYFQHDKLGKEVIVVRGMTQVQFDDRIFYHEDCYDLGEMLYENVPALGFVVNKLKQRLATA